MYREVKSHTDAEVGDKILVTKVNGEVLEAPHLTEVYDVDWSNEAWIEVYPPINSENELYTEQNDVDEWEYASEDLVKHHEEETLQHRQTHAYYDDEALPTSKSVADKTLEDVKVVYSDANGVKFCDRGELAILYKQASKLDEWHIADEDISLDAAVYDEEEAVVLNRDVKVGDTIAVTKVNYNELERVHFAEVTGVYDDFGGGIDIEPCINGEDVLYIDQDEGDKWRVLAENPQYDEEEALQRRQALAYYEDDAITPSYSEFINSGRGRTLADYTGVEITKDSLGFVSKVDEAISSITAESLDFKEESEDVVNHPSHYGNGRFETIEMIEEITKGYDDGFVAHCVGTAVKYESRAPFKHETPLEDLRKARKYLEFAIEHLERMEDK